MLQNGREIVKEETGLWVTEGTCRADTDMEMQGQVSLGDQINIPEDVHTMDRVRRMCVWMVCPWVDGSSCVLLAHA